LRLPRSGPDELAETLAALRKVRAEAERTVEQRPFTPEEEAEIWERHAANLEWLRRVFGTSKLGESELGAVAPIEIKPVPLERPGPLEVVVVDRQKGPADTPMGRPLEPLLLDAVLEAEEGLKKRAALLKPPRKGPYTYTAIATRTKLKPDRLHQLEDLMTLGWRLSKSHPDPRLRKSRPDLSELGTLVWLPTPRQARRLLASG
jgi:hypothetical protein